MRITALITHSGRFHADDLLAYAVLSRIFPGAPLIRTRDADLIARHAGQAVTFDVGHEYDPARLLFDHHQVGKPRRADGGAYSSFGLVWKHFGLIYLRTQHKAWPSDDTGQILERLDARFVRAIDATDNLEVEGLADPFLSTLSLPKLLEALNPAGHCSTVEEDQAFHAAADLAGRLLDGQVQDAIEGLHREAALRRALAARSEPSWIEIAEDIPLDEAIAEMNVPELLFVIARGRGEWLLRAVSRTPGAISPRIPLPEAWAGLRGADLQNACGVEDARFCHAARFLAVSETRDGVIALLRQALDA